MEFYLSPSNLANDKYLKSQKIIINEKSYYSIEIFMNFTKLKNLHVNSNNIRDAIEKSKKLVFNDTKDFVSTMENEISEAERDSKSFYIENWRMGKSENHDTLRREFEQFGKVLLVSLPRFANTKNFKGFGFIEMDSVSSMEKAVAYCQQPGNNLGFCLYSLLYIIN